jgi:competence protein ComEC
VLNPGFQMSFAATLGLVALFEQAGGMLAEPPASGGLVRRMVMRAGFWIAVGALTSLVAGLATVPYAAFHFHRLAPYGIVANLAATPLISFVIMPAALFGVLLLPFGYDALAWWVMGQGIDGMVAIARWVARIPGADGRMAAFGPGAVMLATLGLVMLSLPKAMLLRFTAAPLLAAALLLALQAKQPDVLIDADGNMIAVRGADRRLSILHAERSRIAAESWLAADADARSVGRGLSGAFTCDEIGCVTRLRDGTRVAFAKQRDALADDCGRADLVVGAFDIPERCGAAAVDLRVLGTTGVLALYREHDGWRAEPARSPQADRPWYGRRAGAEPQALARLNRTRAESRPHTETGAGAADSSRSSEQPDPVGPDLIEP